MELEARNANYWLRVPFEVKAYIVWCAIVWNYYCRNAYDDFIIEWICVVLCFMLANAFYHRLIMGQLNEEE